MRKATKAIGKERKGRGRSEDKEPDDGGVDVVVVLVAK